jgi:hypothetical protein
MVFDPSVLAVVFGFMVLANRLVAMLVRPVFEKYQWDEFWLAYPSWILSGILVWFTGVNLFAGVIPSALVGQILTAIVAGGGANLLHDATNNPVGEVSVYNVAAKDSELIEAIKADELSAKG